jgi:Domain of unknown function (DUF4268)
MEFGKIIPVNLRSLWPHEEHDFTPWLCENLTDLGNILGLDLEFLGREVNVGGFTLDVLARETGTGRYVVVENQFGASDHDHLGKLLTYAGGKQAGVMVWIAEKIRDEHRQALEWLNDHTDESTLIFGLELTAFRIDDSKPVFQFLSVVQPNDWAKESKVSNVVTALSSREQAYLSFFQQLLDTLREDHRFTNARTGQAQSWYSFSSGYRGIKFGANFGSNRVVSAEIYIDEGIREQNKRRFDALFQKKSDIEGAFGGELIWERLDERQACRICVRTEGAITDSPEALEKYRAWMISRLLHLKLLWNTQMKTIVMESDKSN